MLEVTLPGYAATSHSSEVSTTAVLVKVGDCGQMHGISAVGFQERKPHKGRQNEISEPGMLSHRPVMSSLPAGVWLQDV